MFQEDLETVEILCPECEALMWVNHDHAGQFYLMRISEIDINECETCSAIQKIVSGSD